MEFIEHFTCELEESIKAALSGDKIQLKGDVTRLITEFISSYGRRLGYEIVLEVRYDSQSYDGKRRMMGDVLWKKSVPEVMWEIDRGKNYKSVKKLLTYPAKFNVWVNWCREIPKGIDELNKDPKCAAIRINESLLSEVWEKIDFYRKSRRHKSA